MKNLPDLWEGCYDGEHRKGMSPQQFKQTFCANCLNSGCRNSKAAGLKWIQRMLTQEDRLLDNPQFADPNDPQYRAIAEQDFQDMIRQALAIEVSSRKGDWSVPTEAEIGVAAAEMVGMIPPSAPVGFKAEPEPSEDPQPPARLVDEVQEYDLGDEMPPPVDENGRRYLSDPGAWKFEVDPDEAVFLSQEGIAGISSDVLRPDEEGWADPNPAPDISIVVTEELPKLRGQTQVMAMLDDPQLTPPEQWRIRGDSGTIYEVSRTNGKWECSCPSRENPCKHARDIELKLSRLTPQPETPAEPEAPTRPPAGPASFVPRRMNTTSPNEGIMIGGGEPPRPPKSDPWAAPPIRPKERVIPVGGRVSFGGGKKKG